MHDETERIPETATIRAWAMDDGGLAEYHDPINGHRQASEIGKLFDRWLAAHDATIRTEQAERDAVIAEGRVEYHNWVPNNSEDNYDAGRVHEASDIAAAIRDAAKEGL